MGQLKTIKTPPDLLQISGLLTPSDNEFGLREVRAHNRHLRLFVAAYMLGSSIRDALALYPERQLSRPGRLTQADIEREVWAMVDNHNRAEEKFPASFVNERVG